MKIQFYKETWVLRQCGGGFLGYYETKAALIPPEPFQVISIQNHKKEGYSDFFVWCDGCLDGDRIYFINVPNGLFKQILE